MATNQRLDLSTFDDRLLDGLDFCRKAYDLFDQVRRGPDGLTKLRLRPTKNEKRLIEELIPIARYVQARYHEGRRIKVRWLSGSQPYDAILWSSGLLVEYGFVRRKRFVEVTTSVHQNEHLARRLIEEGRVSFGAKATVRDKKTGAITSKPYLNSRDETVGDLADQIIERLRSKSSKNYPPGTVLVIDCVANGLIHDSEWKAAIERVAEARVHLTFQEVFLFERTMSHSTTLYGKPTRRRGRDSK